jgi:hypothetical protein
MAHNWPPASTPLEHDERFSPEASLTAETDSSDEGSVAYPVGLFQKKISFPYYHDLRTTTLPTIPQPKFFTMKGGRWA